MPAENLSALWAPWRVEYFKQTDRRDFLTEAAQTTDDAAHLVVARRRNCFLLMNGFPYAVGRIAKSPTSPTSPRPSAWNSGNSPPSPSASSEPPSAHRASTSA